MQRWKGRGIAHRGCFVFLAVAALTVMGCGESDKSPVGGQGTTASISGDATIFAEPPYGRIDNARITILEYPERSFLTGPDGHFHFEGLPVGGEVTLVMEHPDYPPLQTGTITVGAGGAERITFQAPDYVIYTLFAGAVHTEPDPTRCQMVTTVTRKGKSIYDGGAHGEAGATVSITPPLPPEHGPIYFNASVIPNRKLRETSDDGGVLFVNVPPGEYTWTAYKEGVHFTQVKMKCRAGYLVNASPPWGLQAQ